jgi:hypothetical protein
MVRQAALMAFGNLFESMPEAIEEAGNHQFFEYLVFLIARAECSEATRAEAMVCAATAICYGGFGLHVWFIEQGILPFFCDLVGTRANAMLYMAVNATKILFDAMVAARGEGAALDCFEEAGGVQMMNDLMDSLGGDDRIEGPAALLEETLVRARRSLEGHD